MNEITDLHRPFERFLREQGIEFLRARSDLACVRDAHFYTPCNMNLCCVTNCGKPAIAKKLCPFHYRRQRNNIPLDKEPYTKRGAENPKWRGGECTRPDGRVYLYRPEHPNCINGKYVLRYRIVVEQQLGRYLNRNEVVHHINGNPSDDRIENLVVTTQSGHCGLFHRPKKINRWARKHDECSCCGSSGNTPKTRHRAHGLCQGCYDEKRKLRK